MTENARWLAGIDWSSQKHRVCLLDAQGQIVAEQDFAHDGAGLTELCAWLIGKTSAEPGQIEVAIEVPHGPIVETLLERGFAVYAMNPKQVDRFRDRFTVAGAKDDSRDARVLADALRTDRHALRRLAVEDPTIIELREWSRMHEDLQRERTSLTNRVREQLWRYYPQALELAGDDLGAGWFLELWHQAPTPAKAARIHEKTVARILKEHRIRRIDAAKALEIPRRKPISVAPGTAEAASAHIRTVAARLRLISQQVKQAEGKLKELCDRFAASSENEPGQSGEQRDVAILRSSPGIGRIVLATLLAEAAGPLRRRDYHALRTLSGQAPVTKRSGKQCHVTRG